MSAITSVRNIRWAEERSTGLRKSWWLPLALIIMMQALLSVRLLQNAPIASGDEARYIYAGHELIYELWHGGGSPYYETYFSGAPVLYPVLAAMVDHVGSLLAVRLMSLIFMMIATLLAFATSRRLFGYWAGITAAGLFAGIGLTQNLGVYGTYDAMALMLTAGMAYCAVRTAASQRGPTWLLVLPLAILLANSVKYVTLVFDPIVILMAGICAPDTWRHSFRRVLALGSATGLMLVVALFLAGTAYVQGIVYTTLARDSSQQAFLGGGKLISAPSILAESWTRIGIVVVLALLAFIFALLRRVDSRHVALLGLLVIASLLVTVEAIHLHSDQSMRKHDDFGAWFACIAAGALPGYAQDFVNRPLRQYMAAAVGILVITGCVIAYTPAAPTTYEAHPYPPALIAAPYLKPYLETRGRFILGGLSDDTILYTDHLGVPWFQHFDDLYIKYPIPGRGGDSHGQARGPACLSLRPHCMYLEGPAAYETAIRAHWFVLVSMIGSHGTAQDASIEQAVQHTSGYVLLTRAGGSPTWIYAPAYPSWHPDPGHPEVP